MYTVCCQRPKTWETTTEITNIYDTDPNYNEITTQNRNVTRKEIIPKITTKVTKLPETVQTTNKSIKTTKPTIQVRTTTKKPTTTTTKPTTKRLLTTTAAHKTTMSSIDTTSKTISTLPETVTTQNPNITTTSKKKSLIVHTIPTTEKLPTTPIKSSTTNKDTLKPVTESCHENQTSESPSSESTTCCRRPKTWETTHEEPEKTTEIATTTTATEETKKINANTVPIHIDIQTDSSDHYITSFTETETTTKKLSTITIHKIPQETTTKTTKVLSSKDIEKKISTAPTFTTSYNPPNTNHKITKSTHIPETTDERQKLTIVVNDRNQSTFHWWYPTPCKSDKCQRPHTWETTTRRRRYYGRRYH